MTAPRLRTSDTLSGLASADGIGFDINDVPSTAQQPSPMDASLFGAPVFPSAPPTTDPAQQPAFTFGNADDFNVFLLDTWTDDGADATAGPSSSATEPQPHAEAAQLTAAEPSSTGYLQGYETLPDQVLGAYNTEDQNDFGQHVLPLQHWPAWLPPPVLGPPLPSLGPPLPPPALQQFGPVAGQPHFTTMPAPPVMYAPPPLPPPGRPHLGPPSLGLHAPGNAYVPLPPGPPPAMYAPPAPGRPHLGPPSFGLYAPGNPYVPLPPGPPPTYGLPFGAAGQPAHMQLPFAPPFPGEMQPAGAAAAGPGRAQRTRKTRPSRAVAPYPVATGSSQVPSQAGPGPSTLASLHAGQGTTHAPLPVSVAGAGAPEHFVQQNNNSIARGQSQRPRGPRQATPTQRIHREPDGRLKIYRGPEIAAHNGRYFVCNPPQQGHTRYCVDCHAAGKVAYWFDKAGLNRHNKREHPANGQPRGVSAKNRNAQ